MSVAGRDLFTIGHSTHKFDKFAGLLKQHEVNAIADVRSYPFSRLPAYNRDTLSGALGSEGIRYVPLGRELGARRVERECYVDGQVVYERVAQLPPFHEGIQRLLMGMKRFRIALVCAEKDPLDCHRAILVCRSLRPYGLIMQHILADGTLEKHEDTEKRLIEKMDVWDLSCQTATDEDLIERAYYERGEQIAYRENSEEVLADQPGTGSETGCLQDNMTLKLP